MEVLRVSATITLRDLAELEHYKNLKEVHLCSLACPHVEDFLPMLKRCTNLRRLTLAHCKNTFSPVLAREFCDFIMELKDLTFVHIINCNISNCVHFKSLVGEVKAFVLPRRPNFKFYVSCCFNFDELRVPKEFDF